MRVLVVSALVLVAFVSSANAETVCVERSRAKLDGPSPVGFHDARFGSPIAACANNELEFAGVASAIAEPEEFYGNIKATGLLAGSLSLSDRVAIFGAFEMLRYHTVISSLQATTFAPGDLTLGGSWRFVEGDDLAVAAFARTLLPTTGKGDRHVRPIGLDLGVSAMWRTSNTLRWFGHAAVLSTVALGIGPSNVRGGLSLAAGGVLRPHHDFAFVFELDAQGGYDAPLDHLALGLGIRVHRDRRGFELFVKAPLVGRERALAVAGIRLRYDFDVATDYRLR